MQFQERVRGCLVAGAIGDAMGAPVEFLRLLEIQGLTQGRGVTQFYPAYGKPGSITDDTQMTLFTAEAAIAFEAATRPNDLGLFHQYLTQAYLYWLKTQDISPRCEPVYHSFLYAQTALHACRAPGETCISGLLQATEFQSVASNDSKGCGAVMRVAPVGLLAVRLGWNDEQTFVAAMYSAAITHAHPDGQIPAAILAVIIKHLALGKTLLFAVEAGLQQARQHQPSGNSEALINQAIMLASTTVAKGRAISMLGEGWVADEALAMSLYCALVAPDFHQLINISVSHSGDSDSTGSIAGQLWGAQHGMQGIPERWLQQLECAELIQHVANELSGCVQISREYAE